MIYRWRIILLITVAASVGMAGCDEDDPTGPDPTATPSPAATATLAPTPEPTAEPTPEGAYDGMWVGEVVSTLFPAPAEQVKFQVRGSEVSKGEATVWVRWEYTGEEHPLKVELEGNVENQHLDCTHQEGDPHWGYYHWRFQGEFETPWRIVGTWEYHSGAAGESGDVGEGTWYALLE